jgi:carbon dioxide concentrating mechanism protein CcmN
MFVPPLLYSNNQQPYISGEVTIDPTAAIAPGVILQATANAKIIIGAGVCIGMGSILQVHEGILEVETGATLGAGFLMVGNGRIGANACIGCATTVLSCSIEPSQVVASGSIVGDTSRQISQTQTATGKTKQPQPTSAGEQQSGGDEEQGIREAEEQMNSTQEHQFAEVGEPSQDGKSSEISTQDSPPPTQEPQSPQVAEPADGAGSSELATQDSSNNFGNQIYGQENVKRLLSTLFPHNQSLRQPLNDGKSE